jgi:hypothetical protein
MLMCCVCVFLLSRESSDMILGDEPLIFEVVMSQWPRNHYMSLQTFAEVSWVVRVSATPLAPCSPQVVSVAVAAHKMSNSCTNMSSKCIK